VHELVTINKANLVHSFFLVYVKFIFVNLYMFRPTMCPPSGDTSGFMRHLVLVILCGWLSGMQGAPCIPDSHPHTITSTKCRIKAVVYPDDGQLVARNV